MTTAEIRHYLKTHPFGYFADPETRFPLDFQHVDIRHHPGLPLRKPWRYLFWWVRIPRYELLSDILYVTSDGDEIFIEAGFIFNGGSVPFFLWWLYRPDEPDCLPAFTVHDELCTLPYRYDSVKSHRILREACRANGAYRLKAGIVWLGVRVGGPRFQAEGTS